MKYHVLFSLKNNEETFMNVVCCSRDWRLWVKVMWNLALLSLYINQNKVGFWTGTVEKYFFISKNSKE